MSKSKAATWKQTGEWGQKHRKYQDQSGKGKAKSQDEVKKALNEALKEKDDTKVNESMVERLNRMYGSFLAEPVIPVEVVMGAQPVTMAKATDAAFMLNDSINTKNIFNVIETEADRGIIRAKVGLAAAARMENSIGYGYFYLAVLKNAMLIEMAKFFDLHKHKVIWNRPAKPDNYFLDFDTVAGYEIRCYICKTPEVK